MLGGVEYKLHKFQFGFLDVSTFHYGRNAIEIMTSLLGISKTKR